MKTSETKYQIYNLGRKLYCGPVFWGENAEGVKYAEPMDYLNCTYAELSRVGGGFELKTATNFMRDLRKRHPKTNYELHKITTIIKSIPERKPRSKKLG